MLQYRMPSISLNYNLQPLWHDIYLAVYLALVRLVVLSPPRLLPIAHSRIEGLFGVWRVVS